MSPLERLNSAMPAMCCSPYFNVGDKAYIALEHIPEIRDRLAQADRMEEALRGINEYAALQIGSQDVFEHIHGLVAAALKEPEHE